MPDNFLEIESKGVDEPARSENQESSSLGLQRWAHFPALVVFGLVFASLHGHPWRWYIAIDGSYTVYVFFFAIGSVIKDADDFFGDPRLPKYAAKLLVPHAVVLALITCGITVWFRLNAVLPSWATQEGRKGSLWDLAGWLALSFASIAQGFWMAKKIRRYLGSREE